MEYVRQYQNRINWQNEPSLNTPINETNLNKMDNALNYMDGKLSEAVGGGIVEANPSGSATSSLNKIGINGTVYGISGGGGGGSYTAGSGININNDVISNTRKGALTGVIDSVSTTTAHTQINNALDSIYSGSLVVLKAETSGTSIDTIRIQYGAQASDSRDFRLKDTSGNYTTIDIASDDTIIMMLDVTGYQMIVLSILGASTGGGYSGLGIGKKTGVTSNVIDTDIDLHRSPMVGDRLLVYFDEKVTNPIGLTTYNNGTAVTSNLENAVSLYINAGWNILEFKNDGLLYDNCWVRKQNVPIPNNTLSGLSDTAIVSPSDGQLLTFDNETQKWKNKTYVEANTGSPVTELKKLKVGNVVYDTDGLKNYSVTNVANNNITVSVLNPEQFVQEVIAINTGAHTGSSSAWNLVLSGGMIPVSVALTKADGTAFDDDISENELLLIYVDTAGNVARVLDIPVNTTEIKTVSGNPITLTDAVAGNAIEVSAEIVASQSGSGTPSPTNIRPISGFSSVTITREDAQGQTATVTVSLGSTVYGGTLNLTTGELTVNTVSKTYTGETDEAWDGDVSLNSYWSTATIGNKAKGDIICNEFKGVKVNTWNDLHDYEIAFHPTVANTLRVKYSGVANLTAFKAFLASSPMQVVYELAIPTTTTLTAEQLALVKGYNHLTCNSGDMEITYKASGLDALKERVDDLEDAVADLETDLASKAEKSTIGTVENGTTASQPYAVGEYFIRNNKFCTCISAIASGATLTLNTNYVEGTIADNITKRVKYSTSEHIIGTWIDGSTLYEKTIDCGNCLGSTGDVSFSCNFGENITVVDIECVSISKGTDVQITVPFNWDNTYDIGISYSPYWATNNRDMLLFRVKSARSNYQTFATLRYVKGRLYT